MKNKTRKWVRLSFELTSAIHPRGRCCQASIPEHSSNWDLGGVLVSVKLKYNKPGVQGFLVSLSDRDSANDYHYNRQKIQMEGVELEANVKDIGYNNYNLNYNKDIHLESNEKFACTNYAHFGDYNKVKLSNLIIVFMIVVVLFLKSVFYPVPTGKLFGAEHVHHSLHSALDYKHQGSLVSKSCQLVKRKIKPPTRLFYIIANE